MVKVYIDPGHGGLDPGAIGNGLLEKVLTLSISKRISEILIADYDGVTVKLSRTGDQTLSLSQRTNDANAWGADLFLSVHINAGGGTGYEDFVYTTAGTKEASIQNAIHSEVMSRIPGVTDRGKKKANYHVLRESKMPAVLTECLFIDKAADAARLKEASFIEALAQGHAAGIAKAFNLAKKSTAETTKPKEAANLYKPTASAMANATSVVLKRWSDKDVHGDKAIDPSWRTKLLNGELTDSDAIGLFYVAVERGLFNGGKEAK
ncbi:N-acetylmuramoyl-L-alanine amidase family protein [Cytobacillus gottheilii]|uniref:N-acetylmuramoyl-L-alanine amidase n=1 Tax=Cytobacillus gottheilii TaxID=859144 RepID=A0ABX8FG58_9BACI|nr:N-acetylmuramoyl-L-alanine amidase [Cytobacillus gottheilii]QVY63002.1 N-acetylmuramoyl-L-alanine amidase [Cytobacillus gottheilii]